MKLAEMMMNTAVKSALKGRRSKVLVITSRFGVQ